MKQLIALVELIFGSLRVAQEGGLKAMKPEDIYGYGVIWPAFVVAVPVAIIVTLIL